MGAGSTDWPMDQGPVCQHLGVWPSSYRDSMTHALIAVRHAVNAVRGITSIGIEVTKYNAALLHRCSSHNGRIQD